MDLGACRTSLLKAQKHSFGGTGSSQGLLGHGDNATVMVLNLAVTWPFFTTGGTFLTTFHILSGGNFLLCLKNHFSFPFFLPVMSFDSCLFIL